MDCTYACSGLTTNFEWKTHPPANGNRCKFATISVFKKKASTIIQRLIAFSARQFGLTMQKLHKNSVVI